MALRDNQKITPVAAPAAAALSPCELAGLNQIPISSVGWCWAACMEMVMRWDNSSAYLVQPIGTLDQGLRVDRAQSLGLCNGVQCVDGLIAQHIQTMWLDIGYSTVTEVCGDISFGDLVRELCIEARPVEIWWGSRSSCTPLSGTGHTVLVVGRSFDHKQGIDIFTVYDPNPLVSQATYSYDGLRHLSKFDGWVGTWLIHG